jgi:GMP synthase (glutamine-hydrolysing)
MRVLSITHGPSVPGGVFDEAVEAAGSRLERWVVPDGGSPEPAGSYDAVMVFGGSQHPDEDARFAWLGQEEAFLQDVLAAGVPVFGVCLGAQMLARAADAAIGPASRPEIGWHEIVLTDDLPMPADELRAESATRLARSNDYGRALADAFLREASAQR